MGKKDTAEKILADYNDVFADIMNTLIFDGVQRIKPESLINASAHTQYKADNHELHEQERDVAKYWTDGKTMLALCGLENQTKVERNMPFRIIGYDGAAYRAQLLHKRKIAPVITIVLYFGTDRRWNAPRSIKELVHIPKGLEDYVNDYKIKVFEVAWLTDEQLKMFTSDFGIVANFFVQKRKKKDYVPDDPRELVHVDEVLKLLSVMTGDLRYESILAEKEGRVTTMCEVADRLENRGRIEGRIEGENKLATLISRLFDAGRNADAELAAKDEEARKRFYREFGIIN